MVTIDTMRTIALSFPETTEEPHFEKTSFRVRRKIFATYDSEKERACVRLSRIDQDVFSSGDNRVIYPVQNAWGRQGWTFIETKRVRKDLFVDALTTAYCEVAPKTLSEQIRPKELPRHRSASHTSQRKHT